jgi:hypothetical protein
MVVEGAVLGRQQANKSSRRWRRCLHLTIRIPPPCGDADGTVPKKDPAQSHKDTGLQCTYYPSPY